MTNLGASNTAQDEQARRVEAILSRVEALPSLSSVASRLLQYQTAADAEMTEVVKIIESDPALSTRLLGLCRRADKGLGDRITTVKRAVLLLGFDTVRSTALSVSVFNLMNPEVDRTRRDIDSEVAHRTEGVVGDVGGPLAFDRGGFWKHSVAVACCAEIIANMNPRLGVLGAEAFLAGLLHGVGKFVLEFALPKAYDCIVRLARQRGCSSAEAERQLIGIDYLTAGKHVAEHWGLPDPVCKVSWMHTISVSSLPNDDDRDLIAIVACAKSVCNWLHLGWSGDFDPPIDPVRVWRAAGFDVRTASEGLAQLYQKVFEAVADRFEVLGLMPRTAATLSLESFEIANQNILRLNDSLDQRRQAAVVQSRVGDLLARFVARSVTTASEIPAQAGRVLRNAWETMGGGSHALVVQRAGSSAFELFNWGVGNDSKDVVRRIIMHAPPAGTRAAQWLGAAKWDPSQVNVGMMGLTDWLGGTLGGSVSPTSMRVMHLTPTGSGEEAATFARLQWPRALLVSDRELRSERALGAVNCTTLIGAWYEALRTAPMGELPAAA
jgi:HD-like signal output (HDOD) protein